MNLLESCQQICTNILAIEPENEHASVMMADIAFRKVINALIILRECLEY